VFPEDVEQGFIGVLSQVNKEYAIKRVSKTESLQEIIGVRHWVADEYVRIVFDLSAPVEFSKNRLGNPERLFFDIKNVKIKKGTRVDVPSIKGFIRSVRIAQYKDDTVRIVFDLEHTDYEVKMFGLDDPYRFVIDVVSQRAPDDRTKEEVKINPKVVKKRIVVDPGHGGEDPGAVGQRGLYEKDVVLDVALRMKDIIKRRYPSYEVILTREKDVFIPLDKRAAIANSTKADLFISIHANASVNRQARGIETYLLNWTNDMEALKVAARENAISIKKMQQVQNELGLILASLERENKRDESIKLSGYIQRCLVANVNAKYPKVLNLGVKQALFYVLVGAQMPSTLVEISFISNRDEERLLSDALYRQKIAESVVSGIDDYFNSAPHIRVAAVKDHKQIKASTVGYTRK
jgi:N-acetylmuramoyl-L-alanine amidase